MAICVREHSSRKTKTPRKTSLNTTEAQHINEMTESSILEQKVAAPNSGHAQRVICDASLTFT